MASAGDVNYHVRAHLETRGSMTRKFGEASAKARILGREIAAGPTAQLKMLAKATAMVGIGVGAAAIAGITREGLRFNAQMESVANTVGTTLQLFNHNNAVLEKGGTAAEQFAANLDEGKMRLEELVQIANESPGSLEQVATMFQNMLPGARSVTADMNRIMDLTSRTTLLAGVLGNQFDVVGAQMSRILTGGAGAEFETWKLIQRPILEAGKAMGIFNDKMEMGADLTQAFNQLTGETRMRVVEEAMKALGPEVAAHFAKSWEGMTSTAASSLTQLAAKFTTPLFDGFKAFLTRANSESGILAGPTLQRLTDAATFIGEKLASGADRLLRSLETGVTYVADNWETILSKIKSLWDQAAMVAKIYGTMQATKLVAGTAMQAGGAVGQMAAGALGGISSVLKKLGTHALYVMPLLAGLGSVVAAFAVVAVGIGAYISENWDKYSAQIKTAIVEGRLTLAPLINALNLLWGKMTAVGAAMMSGVDSADVLQSGIEIAAKFVGYLTTGVGILLKVGQYTLLIFGYMMKLPEAIASVAEGFWGFIGDLLEFMKADDMARGARFMEDAAGTIAGVTGSIADGALAMSDKLGLASDAFDNAGAAINGLSFNLQSMVADIAGFTSKDYAKQLTQVDESTKKKIAKGEAMFGAGGIGLLTTGSQKAKFSTAAKDAAGKKEDGLRKARTTIKVNKMEIIMDMRDQDPDRIMMTFTNELEKTTRHRVSAFDMEEQGV